MLLNPASILIGLLVVFGPDPVNLTNNPGGDFEPIWSPDGKYIAFYSDRNPSGKCRYKIFTMKSDGSDQTKLPGSECDFRPVFSPDGKKLAFDSARDGNHEIYTVNVDGTDLKRLTRSESYDSSPRWSADGKMIVYFSGNSQSIYKDSDIYIMNADGSDPRNLTNSKGGGETYPFFSPDGKRIAFTSYRDGNAEIYIMDADGSDQRRLTNNPARDDNARWSPDGAIINFGTNRDGNYEVYTMNADGSEKQNVTSHPSNDVDMSWSPDGRRVAFASKRSGNYEIWTMPAPK